jgi:hypothetical protein
MAHTKMTPRKKAGPQGVPHHQLAPKDDGASSSRNPNPDPQAKVARLMQK